MKNKPKSSTDKAFDLIYNTINLHPNWDEEQIKKWMRENITISIVEIDKNDPLYAKYIK